MSILAPGGTSPGATEHKETKNNCNMHSWGVNTNNKIQKVQNPIAISEVLRAKVGDGTQDYQGGGQTI